MAALSLYVVNVCYLFDGSGRPLKDYSFCSTMLGGADAAPHAPANRFSASIVGMVPVPLPKDYVHGVDLQRRDFEDGKWSYVRGRLQFGGWWWWYLYAAWVKVPHGTLGLVALCIVVRVASAMSPSRQGFLKDMILLIPACTVFLVVSSQTGFSRYFRYVVPAAPLFYVWVSQLAAPGVWNRPYLRAISVGCVIWTALGTMWVHPHQLSYFNELAGGPRNGHAHLLDANIDWGQELLHLRKWLDRNVDSKPLYLAYFDEQFCVSPELAEIRGESMLTSIRFRQLAGRQLTEYPAGRYAISVNYLRGYRHCSVGDLDLSVFLAQEPMAIVGNCIYVYELGPPSAHRAPLDRVREQLKRPE